MSKMITIKNAEEIFNKVIIINGEVSVEIESEMVEDFIDYLKELQNESR